MPFKSGVAGSIQASPVLRIETINRDPMTIVQDKLLTRSYRDKAGDYAVPVVLSPRDIVFRQKLFTHIQNNKKVQVGKDQEKAQSEKDSHSKNRGGGKNQTNNQVLIP